MDDRGYIDRVNGERVLGRVSDLGGYAEHLKDLEKWWNKYLKGNDLGHIKFSAKGVIEPVKRYPHLFTDPCITSFLQGDTDGKIWDTQVHTTVDILKAILDNWGRSGVCVGATMCGKTGTANNSHWLAPILHLLTGERYQIITLLPNKRAIEQQANDEYRKFLALYGKCEVQVGTNSITLEQYFKSLLQQAVNLEEIYNPLDSSRSSGNKAHQVRRAAGKILDRIGKICREARQHGIKIIFLIDEIHWGASATGVQWRILDFVADQLFSCGGDFFVGFSATPWQLINLKNIWSVGHRLAPHYCGFNFFNGEPIDPDVEISPPEYMSFADFEKHSGTQWFSNIHRPAYENRDTFESLLHQQQRRIEKGWGVDKDERSFPSSWRQYRLQTESAIANALNWALVRKNPKNGKGAVVRFPYRNMDADAFLRRLKLDPTIEAFNYNGKMVADKVDCAIKQRQGAKENRPYVIFVTGSGRMADRFPVEVKYLFDFSEDSSLIALTQGLLGRATGNLKGNPPPLVVLSHKAVDTVMRSVYEQGAPVKRPTDQVTMIGKNVKRGAPQASITLYEEKLASDEDLLKMWHELQAVVHKMLDGRYSLGGRKGSSTWVPGLWSEIVTDSRLRKIETGMLCDEYWVRPITILRPGMNDVKGFTWANPEKNNVPVGSGKVGFRNVESNSKKNSNLLADLLTDRFVPGGGKRSENRERMEVQMHVRKNGDASWELIAVRLRLKEPTSVYGRARGCLPNPKTLFSLFRTPDEVEQVEEQEGSVA